MYLGVFYSIIHRQYYGCLFIRKRFSTPKAGFPQKRFSTPEARFPQKTFFDSDDSTPSPKNVFGSDGGAVINPYFNL